MLLGKKQRDLLTQRAYYDRVTGLPTPDKLEQAYDSLPHFAEGYAYVLIRADEYRRIREILGRDSANMLLKSIADMLYDQMEEGEAAARVGGGDFTLLVRMQSVQALSERLEKIDDLLAQVQAAGRVRDKTVEYQYHITYRMGVVVLGKQGQTMMEVETIARGAEQMARARNRLFEIYDQTRPAEDNIRGVGLLMDIDRALSQEEFVPYLQPQYSFETGRVSGAEILVRWHHPAAGVLSPGDFLPLLEYDGRVFELDMYMLEQACKLIHKWVSQKLMPVPFSINVSRLTLYRVDFVERALEIARKYDVPEVLISFELEESAVFDSPELVSRVVNQLHKEGFRLVLDNFGRAGYSGMHHVGTMPVDGIKPVRGFFRSTGEASKRERVVLGHLVELSEELGQTLVFAHVETKEQAELLKGLGCKFVQGYLFEEPFPIEAFDEVLFGQPPAHQQLISEICDAVKKKKDLAPASGALL